MSIFIDGNQFYQRKPFVFAPPEGTSKYSRCRTVFRVFFIGGLDVFEQSCCDRIDRRRAWSWMRHLGHDDKSIFRDRADTEVLSQYPRCSVTLFSVNVWDDLNALNLINSLDVFTFFVLYCKALLHDYHQSNKGELKLGTRWCCHEAKSRYLG